MSEGVKSQADFVGGLALALLCASVLFAALVMFGAMRAGDAGGAGGTTVSAPAG
jgi:hypothetical protein